MLLPKPRFPVFSKFGQIASLTRRHHVPEFVLAPLAECLHVIDVAKRFSAINAGTSAFGHSKHHRMERWSIAAAVSLPASPLKAILSIQFFVVSISLTRLLSAIFPKFFEMDGSVRQLELLSSFRIGHYPSTRMCIVTWFAVREMSAFSALIFGKFAYIFRVTAALAMFFHIISITDVLL
jgi:hypothetical protein